MKKRGISLCLVLGLLFALALPASASNIAVTEAIPLQYDQVDSFSEGLASVEKGNKWGFIDQSGQEVIPCRYNDTHQSSDGLIAVELDGRYGFIDQTGREVAPCKYDDAWFFSEGLAVVCLNGKYGFIDQAGREVVPCQYDVVGIFNEGLAPVMLDEKWGFIDQTGLEVTPRKYDSVMSFSWDFAPVQRDNKWGFIDQSGQEIIPCQYDNTHGFYGELAAVALSDKWGYIDRTGHQVIPCQYDRAYPLSDSLAPVILNGKWGFVDQTGRQVIPCQYDDTHGFRDGLAAVMLDGKWGFIDQTGQEVISCQYDDARGFSEDLAAVGLNGRYGYIDRTGQEVVPLKYDYADDFSEGFAAVELDDKWGFLAIGSSAPAPTAYASTQTVTVDGAPVVFQAYALKDANGNDTNYVKLRDVASVLNGTSVQFNVGWNGSVNIEKGQAYVPNGSEMSTPFSGDRAYEPAAAGTNIDGQPAALEAIVLKDDAGGAYTYYKLRDLGAALGFVVDWNAQQGITVTTGSSVSAEDDLVFTLSGVRFRLPIPQEARDLFAFEYGRGDQYLNIRYPKETEYEGYYGSFSLYLDENDFEMSCFAPAFSLTVPGKGVLGFDSVTDVQYSDQNYEEYFRGVDILMTACEGIELLP